MTTFRLNVAIDGPPSRWLVDVTADRSTSLTRLLRDVKCECIDHHGIAPDPWNRYHKLIAPPGIRDDSDLDDVFRNLDAGACTEVPERKALSTCFPPSEINDEYIHILLVHKAPLNEVTDVFKKHNLPYTSDLITIHVARLQAWTKEDVTNTRNNVKLLWCDDDPDNRAPLDETRTKLDRTRSILNPELINTHQYEIVRNAPLSPPVFETSVIRTEDIEVSQHEIDAFASVSTTYVNQVEEVAKKSSHLIDHWSQAYLVAPPMIGLDGSGLSHEYNFDSGVGSGFSLIIRANNQPPRKHTPAPDFLLMPVTPDPESRQGFWPILLGEVISEQNESDRWQMLLQLTVCARTNGVVTLRDRCCVVQGVYINGKGEAERYLAYAKIESNSLSDQVPTVYIERDTFDIRTLSGAVKFLRSMYNFAGLVRAGDSAFDSKYSALCSLLQAAVSMLPTLTSHSAGTRTPQSNLSQLGTPREKTIVEGAAIAMGYETAAASSTHPHVACAYMSEQEHILKLVTIADELIVLKHLHHTSTVESHVIQILRFFSTDFGTVVSMPSYTPLNECSKLPVPMAADLCQQLLTAVQFLHSQNIVHRDLKPQNVVVDLEGDCAPQLFVIDFSLAAFVEGRNDYFADGPVGTEGFTAPEVGFERKRRYEQIAYSPVAADLWATGSLMEYIMMSSENYAAPEFKTLWRISKLLTHSDPMQRPSAEDALAILSSGATHCGSP